MADAWEDMTDVQRASALELMGGKRQANVLSALIQNFDTVEKVIETSANSSGSALEENERYLDSIQGKIDQFNNAMQAMWSNTLHSDMVKGFVEFGTILIQLIDKVGLLQSVLVSFGLAKLLPIVTGMGSLRESLKYVWTMMTSINGTGASLVKTIKTQTSALWAANSGASTLALSFQTAKNALKAFAATPLGWLTIATVIIGGAIKLFDATSTSLKEQVDNLKEARREYKESKQTLSDLNSELKTTEDRIKELQSLGTLTITEKDELNELKKYNLELEKRIKLAEKVNAKEAKEQANEAVDTYKKLPEVGDNSDRYQNYFDGEFTGLVDPENWDNFFARHGQVDGASLDYINAVYDHLTGVYNGYIDALEDDDYDKKLKILHPDLNDQELAAMSESDKEAIINSEWDVSEVQKAIDGLRGVLEDVEASAFNLISDETKGYQALLDDMAPRYEYLQSVNPQLWSESDKEIVSTYQEIEQIIQNIWNKYDPSGWFNLAKQDIWADEQFEGMYDPLVNLAKDGHLDENELRANFDEDIVNALIKACEDKGIFLNDLLNDIIADANRGGTSTNEDQSIIASTLSKITALEDAYNSLGDAIKEFKEEGRVSAGILEGLNETFGKVDGFEELYKVLATGEGDLEIAVTNVANAYVGQAETLSNMTDEELKIMVSRLEALGVLNAEEVLMARQKGQAQLDALGLAYSIDLSNYGTAEQAKLAIAQMAGLNIANIQGDTIEALEKAYGMDLSAYGSVAEAKIAIAQKVAKEEAEANKSTLLSDYQSGKITSEEYNQGIDNINNSLNFADNSVAIQSIIDNAYKGFEFNFDGQIGIGSDFDEDLIDKATQEANDRFQKEMDYWENRIGAEESRFEQIQNEIDLLEAKGIKAGAKYYQEQIESENRKLELLNKQKTEANRFLKTFKKGSDEWWNAANTLNDLESEIDDVTASIIDLQTAMADTHWYMFDEAHDRISNVVSDLENIRNILSNEKLFDEEGNFTKEGLGTLASYVQELGIFEEALAKAREEVELFGHDYDPNKKYVDAFGNNLSIDSEQDWYEAAEKAEEKYDEWNQKVIETRYNIKDLYEQQIDAVEEYTDTLVESYQDYIEVVKEALDSERDLYEFKKSTQEKSKNIASIERRIASLSGSTNAADVAERRKLQAELTDAKSDMDDHYYSHAKEQQAQALDDEMTSYEQAVNAYIESLRTKLEESTKALYLSYDEMSAETQSFVDGVTQSVVLNAGNVKDVYLATGETIDQSLVTPWTNAAAAIGKFASSEGALGLMNSWTQAKAGAPFYDFQTKVSGYLSKPWSTIIAEGGPVKTFQTSVKNVVANIVENVKTNVDGLIGTDGVLTNLKAEIDKIKDTTIRITTVYETQGNGGAGGGGGGGYIPPTMHEDGKNSYHIRIGTKADATAKKESIGGGEYIRWSDGYYYPASALRSLFFDVDEKGKKTAVWGIPSGTKRYKYYAKGTTGTTRNQWAITDEPQFGDELVLVPTAQGNLSYMRKGTSVIPADISANLMKWGKLTPDMLNTAGMPNVNMISNAVNKPELNITFDSLVKAENITEETLPAVKKLVTQELNRFTKELNYALKGKGAR